MRTPRIEARNHLRPYLGQSRRHTTRLILVLIAGLLVSSGCPAPPLPGAAGPPGASFGLTSPISLLRFQMSSNATWEQYASYCPREQILIALEAWLDTQPDCNARLLDRGHSGYLLDMQCTIATERNTCEQEYQAWMWVEYVSSSTTDYQLLGYSWVRRVCPSGSMYEASWRAQEIAEKESQALKEFLDVCRQPREVARGF